MEIEVRERGTVNKLRCSRRLTTVVQVQESLVRAGDLFIIMGVRKSLQVPILSSASLPAAETLLQPWEIVFLVVFWGSFAW